MKTILLFFILLFSAVQLHSQESKELTKIKKQFDLPEDTSKYTIYTAKHKSQSLFKDGDVPYIVGSSTIPGYNIEVRICPEDESVTLSNGKRIAGISCIIIDKSEYIGGQLVFGNDTTTIIDITIEAEGKEGAKFTVKGKKFNMEFTLLSGIILKLENNYSVFNTSNKGIWSITKKV